MHDLIIIGAGPIGMTCAIEAKRAGLDALIIDKGMLVNTLFHFPTNMTFFSTSLLLEIGDVPFVSHDEKPTRRESLEYYRRVYESWKLNVHFYEEVLDNVVIVEGEDGLFRFLPYSTDINAGYAWGGAYSDTALWGFASLSDGCRQDESCREAMYDTCEEVIDALEALDGVSLIHDLADRLLSAQAPWGDHPDGMWRGPDVSAYAHYLKFHEGRVEQARAELALYREGGWDTGGDTGSDTGGDTGGGRDTGAFERSGTVAKDAGRSAR